MTTILASPSSSPKLKNCEAALRPLCRGALLTTDFPPVLGGISNYLFNVYRQFDLRQMTLIAPQHPDAGEFDSAQDYAAKRFGAALNVPGVRGAWQVWRMYVEAEKLVKQNRNLVLHCGHGNAAIEIGRASCRERE